MKLNVKAFAITLSIFGGLLVFITTWWLIAQGAYVNEKVFFSYIYPFYEVSPTGSIIGFFYGLIDGFIFGGTIGWLYNVIVQKDLEKTEV